MNLHKALKVKNRLAGDLANLQSQFSSMNCRTQSEVDHSSTPIKEIFGKLLKTTEQLQKLKSAIATATQPIVAKLVLLAEYKSEISFYRGININESTYAERFDDRIIQKPYVVFLSEKERSEKIQNLNILIDELQDQVDAFNASTYVETKF